MDFEEIYKQYFLEVYQYIRSLSSDDKIAEEITQEAFYKALKSIDKFDGSKDIRAWLFTIARNTYFTYYKKEQRHTQLTDSAIEDVQLVNYLTNREDAFAIHQFIHHMLEPYKEVFSLRVFGELSFESIGKLFGKSSGWARVTFYRAKKQIIKHMEEMNNERD